MMKRKALLITLMIFMALGLASCAAEQTETTAATTNEETSALQETLKTKEAEILMLQEELRVNSEKLEEIIKELETEEPQQLSSSSTHLLSASIDVLNALSTKDMVALTALSHPLTPIRFTPYAYVDPSSDLTFSASAFATLINDPTIYTWGAYDGSGDPLDLSFNDYLDDFVYDEDYLNPHIVGINNTIGWGNSLNNVATAYPNASFVEFHFTGFDPQYDGIDWSSLILVFEQVSGNWKLVGIVHNQWTI